MKLKILILVLICILLMAAVGVVLANGGVTFPRWVLGGGASDSTTGNVTMHATLGQPVVGVISSSAGQITLGQGFWGESFPTGRTYLYLPLVRR